MYCDSYFIDFVYAIRLVLALVSFMLTRYATRFCVLTTSISYILYALLFNDLILIYTSYLLFHIHFNMHTTIQWHKEEENISWCLSPAGHFHFWGQLRRALSFSEVSARPQGAFISTPPIWYICQRRFLPNHTHCCQASKYMKLDRQATKHMKMRSLGNRSYKFMKYTVQ